MLSAIAATLASVCAAIAQISGGSQVTNEASATFLFKNGQRAFSRSNQTETIVLPFSSIATDLDLRSSPQAIPGNGLESSLIEAIVTDTSGNPVPDGQPVRFATSRSRFAQGTDTAFALTLHGVASVSLTSELVHQEIITATVSATTLGANDQLLDKHIGVDFYPAGIQGSVVSATIGKVMARHVAVAYNESNVEIGRDTTDASGAFLIPLHTSGLRTLALDHTSRFGDRVRLLADASVDVPTSGGVPPVQFLSSLAGSMVDGASSRPLRKGGIQLHLRRISTSGLQSTQVDTASQLSDDRGIFMFQNLSPGSYEIQVMDPHYSGAIRIRDVLLGTFVVDADIEVGETPSFEVIKQANKRIAEIGDAVSYVLDIRNASQTSPVIGLSLTDDLPHAFVFLNGSARLNGISLPDPSDKRALQWKIADTLQPGQTLRLSYAATVGAGGLESDGINRAYAAGKTMAGEAIRTAVSSVQVTVRQGIFADRGIIIGKVFYDENENGSQEDGEDGIPHVELAMEDGTRIVTGDDGKYSLPEVQPGQHVLRVSRPTLPTGSELLSPRSEFAGDGETRFIRLTEGGIVRADFPVMPPRQASFYTAVSKLAVSSVEEQIEATYTIGLHDLGATAEISLVDTLPRGFHFDLKSISLNDSTITGEDDNHSRLRLRLGRRAPNSLDVVKVHIYADSMALGRRITHRARLILSYLKGRDAVFTVKSTTYPPPVGREHTLNPERGSPLPDEFPETNTAANPQARKLSLDETRFNTSPDQTRGSGDHRDVETWKTEVR